MIQKNKARGKPKKKKKQRTEKNSQVKTLEFRAITIGE